MNESARYNDIIAYDATRIIPSETEYVNASLIVEPELGISPRIERKYWVAAQAPLEDTIHAFLSLLLSPPSSSAYTSNSPTPLPLISIIVQLTSLIESGRVKCEKYFPNSISEEAEYTGIGNQLPIKVKLLSKSVENGIRISKLQLTQSNQPIRIITHFEYLGWGDHGKLFCFVLSLTNSCVGVPTDAVHLIKFIDLIQQMNSNSAPILVHCSAGVGRTGTLIALSSLLPLSKLPTLTLLPLPPNNSPLPIYPATFIDLPRDFIGLTVDRLRDQRTTMVQTESQLRFLFHALNTASHM